MGKFSQRSGIHVRPNSNYYLPAPERLFPWQSFPNDYQQTQIHRTVRKRLWDIQGRHGGHLGQDRPTGLQPIRNSAVGIRSPPRAGGQVVCRRPAEPSAR